MSLDTTSLVAMPRLSGALGRTALRYGIAVALSIVATLAIAGLHGVPAGDLIAVVQQAVLTPSGLLDDLRAATPQILGGVAFAIGARAGIFNIGLAGQYYWGGFAAAAVGIHLPGPSFLVIPACIAAGCLAGALWALPAALLKRWLGINELVTTLMGNYIAVLLVSLVVKTWFLGPGYVVASLPIRPEAEIPPISPGLSDANYSFVLALVVPAIFALILSRTALGFALRSISSSPAFARYAGVDVARTQLTAFLLSGAVAGMVGAGEVLGVLHRYITGFADDIALDGLVVAVLGGSTPLGVLLVGAFLGVLRNIGFVLAQFTDMSSYVITLIFSIFVLTYISDPAGYARALWNRPWRRT
jgi:simple sugar transport system permease protein